MLIFTGVTIHMDLLSPQTVYISTVSSRFGGEEVYTFRSIHKFAARICQQPLKHITRILGITSIRNIVSEFIEETLKSCI